MDGRHNGARPYERRVELNHSALMPAVSANEALMSPTVPPWPPIRRAERFRTCVFAHRQSNVNRCREKLAPEGHKGIGRSDESKSRQGNGRVVGTYFQKIMGTSFRFVPYRGAAQLTPDLLTGQIDLTFTQVANTLEQVRAIKA